MKSKICEGTTSTARDMRCYMEKHIDPNTNATSVESFTKFKNLLDCIFTKVAQSVHVKKTQKLTLKVLNLLPTLFYWAQTALCKEVRLQKHNMRNIYANICTDLSAYVFKGI